MKLSEWVDEAHGRQTALAEALGCDAQLVWQWAREVRPVPLERCRAIERATCGAVQVWDTRPDDWTVHWPELMDVHRRSSIERAERSVPISMGARVRAARQGRRWTLKKLASAAGLGVGTLSALERRNSNRSEFVPALAGALGMTCEELLTGGAVSPALPRPPTLAPCGGWSDCG